LRSLRFRQGSFAPRALPRFHAPMSPSDSLRGTDRGYGFPRTVPGFPWAVKGLSVPLILFRHAPSLPTPESPPPAYPRCFRDGDRLPPIWELGHSRLRITRPNRVRSRYGSCLRPHRASHQAVTHRRACRATWQTGHSRWTPFRSQDNDSFTDAPDCADLRGFMALNLWIPSS